MLKERRKELGLSQREIAEAVGVVPSTISLWERKKVLVPNDKIEKLAEKLKMSVNEIVSRNEKVGQAAYDPLYKSLEEAEEVMMLTFYAEKGIDAEIDRAVKALENKIEALNKRKVEIREQNQRAAADCQYYKTVS